MPRELQLVTDPVKGFDKSALEAHIREELKLSPRDKLHVVLQRRSIDARSRTVKINLTVTVYINEDVPGSGYRQPEYKRVSNAPEVIVIGAGPAGLFAALRLIELGYKPLLFERGKDVRSRRRDLAAINREHIVNPESNYCFGEGGAGTYSDGKLYTRSHKRGSIRSVLETFFAHGAVEEILIDTHPHIGTNKLPGIIVSMREKIIECGGEVHFNSKLTGIIQSSGKLKSVEINGAYKVKADALILATGHSARDIFMLMQEQNLLLEFKPFALGVRVEHPQALIDSIQYKCDSRGDYLPPASYSLVEQVRGKGVYSFCMCPGGIIAPCATSPGEVVTNGWSPSKRNNPFANSGIVVEIDANEVKNFAKYGELAGMFYQKSVEEAACVAGGGTQSAPAQRMTDFCEGKISSTLPDSSYPPGVVSAHLGEVLPEMVYQRLKDAFTAFGKKMRGYFTSDALVHAVESRTSTPVRIPRDILTLQHPQLSGLFPCGEGSGYAGGIVSAAMDGQKCADAVSRYLGKS